MPCREGPSGEREPAAPGDLATAGGLRIEIAGIEFRRGRFAEAVRLYSAALGDPSVRDSNRRRTVAEVNLGLEQAAAELER